MVLSLLQLSTSFKREEYKHWWRQQDVDSVEFSLLDSEKLHTGANILVYITVPRS